MNVSSVMNQDVEVIHFSDSIKKAAEMMRDQNFGSIPVEKDDRLAGMITDRDITVRVVAEGKDPEKVTVEEVMSPGIDYCFEDETIAEVSEKMASSKHRRLPVLNKNKRLVGIVSLGDLTMSEDAKPITNEVLKRICH